MENLNASELRSGSIVNRKYFNPHPKKPSFEYEPCIIVSIGKKYVIVTESLKSKSEIKINISELQPIPLTEKCLIDFGISKENGYPYKFLNGYIKIRNGIYFFKYHKIDIDLPYLHDLQNLHYTLKQSKIKY